MAKGKRGGRACRCQRDARHAHGVPTEGHRGNSLARREADAITVDTVIVVGLLVLAVLLCGLAGGCDDEADLVAHAEWMAGLKEGGAWVMW